MSLRIHPVAPVLALALVSSGCGLVLHEGILAGLDASAQSKKLPEDRIPRIEKDVTTKQEIEGFFGKPDSQVFRPENETIWIYYRGGVPSNIPGVRTSYHQNLMIHFDKDGKVKEYNFTTGVLKPF